MGIIPMDDINIFPYFGGTIANKLLSEENLSTITRSFGLGNCGYLDYTEDAEGEEQEIRPFYVTCNPIEISYQSTNVEFTITKGKGQINGYQIETTEPSLSKIEGIFLEGYYLCLKLSSPTNGRLKAISELGEQATNIEFVKVDWGEAKKKEKRYLLPLAKLVKNSSGKLEPLYICPTSATPNITTDGTTASQASFNSNGINLYSDNDFDNYRASIGKSKIDIKNIGSMSTLVDDNIELKAKRSNGTAYSRLYINRGSVNLLSVGDSSETNGELNIGGTMKLQSKTDLSVFVGGLKYLYLDSGTDGAIFGVNNKPTTINGNAVTINGSSGILNMDGSGIKLSYGLPYIQISNGNITLQSDTTNGTLTLTGKTTNIKGTSIISLYSSGYGISISGLYGVTTITSNLVDVIGDEFAIGPGGSSTWFKINNGLISLTGDTTITGTTTITGNTAIAGNESVTGDITVSGNATIGGSNKQVAINGTKVNINSKRTTNNATSIGGESQHTWIEAGDTIHIARDTDNRINVSDSGVSIRGSKITINQKTLANFVVEEGTTADGWTYREWNNGRYEAWKTITETNLSYDKIGSIYQTKLFTYSLPAPSSKNIKYLNVSSSEIESAACYGIAETFNNTQAYIHAWSPTGVQGTFGLYFYLYVVYN